LFDRATSWTILMTDLVDSAGLTERLGDAGAAALGARHDRDARDLLRRHDGLEIDKSDGFLLLFESQGAALSFAAGYHAALGALSAETGSPIEARAGLHRGEVLLRKNTPEDVARGAKPVEIEGLAKVIAARVMGLAGAGRTLLTAAAAGAGEWTRHGHYQLKGIQEPVEIVEAHEPPRAAPADTPKAWRVVRSGGVWTPAREIPNNLPPASDSFIGRGGDIRALDDLIARERARLVTVLGPGGTGKTRLTLAFAQARLADFSGGAWFVDLTEARSLEGILSAVAAALGVPSVKGAPGLGERLRVRGRALVLLDNFEQLVSLAPETLGVWLSAAPEAVFLVSSREVLGLREEHLFELEPLPLPPPLDAAVVRLFEQRARQSRPGFTLTEEDLPAVSEIVHQLDGMPLAIELAAARVRVMSPARIRDRLSQRFRLLTGGRRGASSRQATLRGAIDWTWALLDPWEQAAFAQCSVFRGGFTMEAAEAVLDLSVAGDGEPPWTVDVVESLRNKSVLRVERGGAGGQRLSMYLTIRAYAEEKLAGGAGAAQARHAGYYADMGRSSARRQDLESLAPELDNLLAAAERAGSGETAAWAAVAAVGVLRRRGPFGAGIDLLERLLAEPSLPAALRQPMTLELASLQRLDGRSQAAEETARLALRIARDDPERGRALTQLGVLLWSLNRPEEARAHHSEALALYRAVGDSAICLRAAAGPRRPAPAWSAPCPSAGASATPRAWRRAPPSSAAC